MSLDPIPQARVVKQRGQLMAPPRAPRTNVGIPIGQHLRTGAQIAVGMWPLTAIVLLLIGFLLMGAKALDPH